MRRENADSFMPNAGVHHPSEAICTIKDEKFCARFFRRLSSRGGILHNKRRDYLCIFSNLFFPLQHNPAQHAGEKDTKKHHGEGDGEGVAGFFYAERAKISRHKIKAEGRLDLVRFAMISHHSAGAHHCSEAICTIKGEKFCARFFRRLSSCSSILHNKRQDFCASSPICSSPYSMILHSTQEKNIQKKHHCEGDGEGMAGLFDADCAEIDDGDEKSRGGCLCFNL